MFRDWIKNQVHRKDDVGELARLVAAGSEPPVGESKFTWSLYLRATYADSPHRVAAFDKAWAQYIQDKKSKKEDSRGRKLRNHK